MKHIVWVTTLLIISIVFIFPAVMALFIDMIPSSDQPGYSGSIRVPIFGERVFAQKFISNDRNLVAIGTSIKNPNLKNKKEIIFNLYDENNNLIRTSILSGKNIEDGDFVKFVFDKIDDSFNKEFKFTLSSTTAGQEEIIELFLIQPTSSIIEYTYQKETYLGGTPMVTFYKPGSKFEIIKLIYFNLLSKLLPLGSDKR